MPSNTSGNWIESLEPMAPLARPVEVGPLRIGDGSLTLIAGPCAIESEGLCLSVAEHLTSLCADLKIPYIFKSSFDKANRTSISSFRGHGLDNGLRVLKKVKEQLGVPVLTDVHETDHVQTVAETVDVLQIPAFLSRQTDLLEACGRWGQAVNIKKGQFLAPLDLRHVVEKVTNEGNQQVIVTERGTSFGYNNLVVDMRSFPQLQSLGYPVIYDVTHSLQLPGAGDGVTSGQAQFIESMASAGVAAGVNGIFLEVHEQPNEAKSDAANALALNRLEPLLRRLVAINETVALTANTHNGEELS